MTNDDNARCWASSNGSACPETFPSIYFSPFFLLFTHENVRPQSRKCVKRVNMASIEKIQSIRNGNGRFPTIFTDGEIVFWLSAPSKGITLWSNQRKKKKKREGKSKSTECCPVICAQNMPPAEGTRAEMDRKWPVRMSAFPPLSKASCNLIYVRTLRSFSGK